MKTSSAAGNEDEEKGHNNDKAMGVVCMIEDVMW